MARILITPKINPDLDGFACAYAYAQFLNAMNKEDEYVAGIYGEVQGETAFLVDHLKLSGGFIFNPTGDFDKFIIVDASDTKGMPEIIRQDDVIEVIDHRQMHQAFELFVNAEVEIEAVGAAATLIFERMNSIGFEIDKNIAVLLLGAIFSNTLNFKSDIASERDREAANFLARKADLQNLNSFIEEMFEYKTKYIASNLEKAILGDIKVFENGLGIAQLEGFSLGNLVSERSTEIRGVLNDFKKSQDLQFVFLTAANVDRGFNNFLACDKETEKMLADIFNIAFDGKGIAKTERLFLRKQLLPILNGRT